ncbi:MAG TPA: DUF2079 domain-containing protein [Pseudonocardiaceae bacterium]|nr:DUF2079 domain-containing protein [Pseudonocardiaceae bacterium]
MLTATQTSQEVPTASRHAVAVTVIGAAAALGYGAIEFWKFLTFRASSYDLVIFDQAVRAYSRFHAPVSVVDGVHRGFGTHFAVLGDHFSPILAVLAPLYWVHSGPATLLVAQALLFASAIPPLWVFTRRELGPFAAYCVAVAYAVSWPVAQAVAFDFHEVAFVPVLTAVLVERCSAYRRDQGRWWQLVLPAVGLLAVKEDMGLLVAAFGVAVLVLVPRRREARWLGAGFVAGGLAAVVVSTAVLLPAMGSKPQFYWRYGQFGQSLPTAAWHMLTHPATTLVTFTHPDVKIHTMVLLGTVAAFASLLSPFALLVLPQLAERMLADAPNWWTTRFHYDAFVVVALLCAGVDGVARVRRWTARHDGWRVAGERFAAVWAVAVLVIGVWNVPGFGFDPLLHPSSWHRDAAMRAEAAAVARVPSGVTVEAANTLGPALTGRATVVLWDQVPRWAPWVVADTTTRRFPFCDVAQQRARVAFLVTHGYRIVFADDGFQVLHHPGPLPPTATAQAPDCS